MPSTPRTYPPACLLAWLTACAMPGSRSPEAALVQRTVITMGTSLTVTAAGPAAEPAIERAIQAVHEADRRWSSWRTDSLLTRIHTSAPGTKIVIDEAFRAGWQLARSWSERTGGTFDPAIGSLLSCWGVRHGGNPTPPSQADLSRARSAAGTRCFRIGNGTITRCHADAKIAEGGFVKGLALDTAIAEAVGAFPGLQQLTLDFGGQLAWWYRPDPHGSTGQAVRSLVAHPVERTRAIASIAHGPLGSLATSGNSERRIQIDGRRHSHILDPRSGAPAPDWGSVTVLVSGPDSACAADCLSTALFVLGPSAGLTLAKQLPRVEALFLEKTGAGLRWHMTDGMQTRLRRLEPSQQHSNQTSSNLYP